MPSASAVKKITASLNKRLAELTGQARTIGDFRTDTGGDVADVAFNTTENEICLRLAQHNSHEITLIKLALDKIASGKYGTCESCTQKIMPARLEALPYSIYCVKCQGIADKGGVLSMGRVPADWEKVGSGSKTTDDDDGDRMRNDRMVVDQG